MVKWEIIESIFLQKKPFYLKIAGEALKMPEFADNKRALLVEIEFPVQTYDIDFAGIVSNIVYIRWLEDLRIATLTPYLPLQKILENGIAPIVMQTTIEYKQPINIFDRPIGKMWMSRLKLLKWTVTAEFVVSGKVATIAEQKGCFIDLSTRKPVAIPSEISQAYLTDQS